MTCSRAEPAASPSSPCRRPSSVQISQRRTPESIPRTIEPRSPRLRRRWSLRYQWPAACSPPARGFDRPRRFGTSLPARRPLCRDVTVVQVQQRGSRELQDATPARSPILGGFGPGDPPESVDPHDAAGPMQPDRSTSILLAPPRLVVVGPSRGASRRLVASETSAPAAAQPAVGHRPSRQRGAGRPTPTTIAVGW